MEMGGSCRDPVGVEFVFAGTPQGCFRSLPDDKNLGASVRILHCVPIKTSIFYFMNNSVKNQVI